MSDKALHEILVRPLLTERGTGNQEKYNQYLFEAAPDATKTDIKRAVETMFKVTVEKIRTQVVPGKFRRFGRGGGMPRLEEGHRDGHERQKIDFATPPPKRKYHGYQIL